MNIWFLFIKLHRFPCKQMSLEGGKLTLYSKKEQIIPISTTMFVDGVYYISMASLGLFYESGAYKHSEINTWLCHGLKHHLCLYQYIWKVVKFSILLLRHSKYMPLHLGEPCNDSRQKRIVSTSANLWNPFMHGFLNIL